MMNKDQNGLVGDFRRLKEIREREGISLRSISKRMGVSQGVIRDQEEGRYDLRLSDLYRWQKALRVPMSDLLDSETYEFPEEIRQRACLVRVARTAKSLASKCDEGKQRVLASRIVDELHKLMPELEEVSAWPEGRSRPQWDLGRAGEEISLRDWMLPELDP